MNSINRRSFFSTAAKAIVGLAVAPAFLRSLPAFADALLPLVDPSTDGMAKSVNYVSEAKKNPGSKGNKCATCALYTQKEKRAGKDYGACALFPNKLVDSRGFCNSWSKKQG